MFLFLCSCLLQLGTHRQSRLPATENVTSKLQYCQQQVNKHHSVPEKSFTFNEQFGIYSTIALTYTIQRCQRRNYMQNTRQSRTKIEQRIHIDLVTVSQTYWCPALEQK